MKAGGLRTSHLLTLAARTHRGHLVPSLRAQGLSAGEELVLTELALMGELTQSELAGRLAVRAPTVTTVLRTMEREGLVERRRDAADGRVVRVRASAQGRRRLRAITQGWDQADAALLSVLSPAERRTLKGLLARLVGQAPVTAPEASSAATPPTPE